MARRTIYITQFDKDRLERMLETYDEHEDADAKHLLALEEELRKCKVVLQEDIPPDVVTMNSRVRLRILDSGEEMICTLVFPTEADINRRKMSILAPVGTALIGYGVGDIVEWKVPAGLIRLRIEEVLYQPEAAGDYHL